MTSFYVLLRVLDRIFFLCSIFVILGSSIILFQGVCMSNAWQMRYISDQLALCLESDSPSFRTVPWLLAYGVAYQGLYLLRLWKNLYGDDKQLTRFSGLLFHATVCHFVTNVAAVTEFQTNSVRVTLNPTAMK